MAEKLTWHLPCANQRKSEKRLGARFDLTGICLLYVFFRLAYFCATVAVLAGY